MRNYLKSTSKLSIVIIASIMLVAIAIVYFSGNDPGKKNLSDFIYNHYTVTSEELDSCKKYNCGDTEEYLMVNDQKVKDIGKYMTETALSAYSGDRISTGRLVDPLLGNYTVEVRDIKLNIKDIQDEGLLSYDATFTLVEKGRSDHKETKETYTQTFYLSKENNQWKVNEFNRFYLINK